MEIVLCMKYIDTELVYLNVWEIKKNLRTDPILKWEIIKKKRKKKEKCHKYKVGNKHCNLFMEEKFTVNSYDNSNQLLNQRWEIRNVCRHKNV